MFRSGILFHIGFLAAILAAAMPLHGVERQQASLFVGQDLYLAGPVVLTQNVGDRQTLVFPEGLSMTLGANVFQCGRAVVILDAVKTQVRGRSYLHYEAQAYLSDSVSVKKGDVADTTAMTRVVLEGGRATLVGFTARGQIFVTADQRHQGDPGELDLYRKALAAVGDVGPGFITQPGAVVKIPSLPALPERAVAAEGAPTAPSPGPVAGTETPANGVAAREMPEDVPVGPEKPKRRGLVGAMFGWLGQPAEILPEPRVESPVEFNYPVNMAPAGRMPVKIDSVKFTDQLDAAVVTGRFYLWQRQDAAGRLLELQADTAVIFYQGRQLKVGEDTGSENLLATGAVQGVYLAGNVVMTEGTRAVRGDELYYDFEQKKALALNASIRTFDVSRGIPIYVRAAKIRQLAENKFSAQDVVVTTSEFHKPQLSVRASEVLLTDATSADGLSVEGVSDSNYDLQMRDVRLKAGERTLFGWPFIRSNLERPDVPLRSAGFGQDKTWGTSLETRWYLARLLGLRESPGTKSTLGLDFYSKRGVGAGAEIEYTRPDSYGKVISYLINDHGKDRLGRSLARKDIEPPNEMRGRFLWQHRHFLPHEWQLSSEVSYISDRNFLESFYRSEFNTDKEQETLLHLKRVSDNQGLSILNKVRINDYAEQLEELPTVEHHLAAQSLFNDAFTFYNSAQASRLRQRVDTTGTVNQDYYSFLFERAELDLPLKAGDARLVPFVAGTMAYEDGMGFNSDIDSTAAKSTDAAMIGEAGLRASMRYWKVYPHVRSKTWDLDGLRHIIKPEVLLNIFGHNNSAIEQRDIFSLGFQQRLQTKRKNAGYDVPGGEEDGARTVDWMRLGTYIMWVDDSGSGSSGPDLPIWNRPLVPLINTLSSSVPQQDRRSTGIFGPRRDSIWTDYAWRVSDTLVFLADMNVDIQSGVVQQLNVGVSRLCWPNLSYYIGSRHLRRIDVMGEKGSTAFTFAATYRIDPRYSLAVSNQYDFDYGAVVRNEVTLIRKYHRVCWALTYSADHSLDDTAVVLSVWPEGVSEVSLGSRRYAGLGTPSIN